MKIVSLNKDLTFNEKSFYLGTFFLASALPLSLLFYLISIIGNISINKIYKVSKYHIILLLCSGLMIVSTIKSITAIELLTFIDTNKKEEIIVGLLNWIPLFIFFLTSQRYLKTANHRKLFGKIFISGSIPVIFSCALQYWFKIYGPFETLNGSIIWFLRDSNGVAGLFSNQNYTGLWLTILLPFLISDYTELRRKKLKRIIITSFIFSTLYFIFLTSSRNAILGLLITICMFYGIKYFLIIPFISIFIISSVQIINNYFFKSVFIYHNRLLNKIFNNTLNLGSHLYSRLEIYNVALTGIFEKPFFGWGSSLFPNFYSDNGGSWVAQHSHNLPLEVAFNYGLPASILLTALVLILIINAFQKSFNELLTKNHFTIDKAWITASLIVIVSQIFDVTYYDGKISILIWILLSGLKCIIDDKSQNNLISAN